MVNSTVPECNVLFIIGNGFDLGLNMKTGYRDIYESYISEPSKTKTIAALKNELASKEAYEKWSDFEMGMAQYAQKLSTEDELIECVRDFKRHMVQHLDMQNQNCLNLIRDKDYATDILAELNHSLENFHLGLTPNDSNQINNLFREKKLAYNFITFNYTNVLEAILKIKQRHNAFLKSPPLHIHGSLNNDVVLGIDNVFQLTNLSYELSQKGKRTFVKTFFNEQFDLSRVNTARRMISESSVICTYGFSMGKSDKTWTDSLVKWLYKDKNHHLVVYQYDTTKYSRFNFDEIMETEDNKKRKLLIQLDIEDDAVWDQIHIPISYDIFNFIFIKTVSNILPHA